MLLEVEDSQLVLVDYQTRLMPALFQADLCVANAMRLAQAARLLGVPTWGTEQNPEKLGPNPPEMKALCRQTLAKMHFSACEEGLVEWLRPAVPAKPAGNARSLPKHLQNPLPQQSHPRRLWWRGSKPMCVCCKRRWICWTKNLRCGW